MFFTRILKQVLLFGICGFKNCKIESEVVKISMGHLNVQNMMKWIDKKNLSLEVKDMFYREMENYPKQKVHFSLDSGYRVASES